MHRLFPLACFLVFAAAAQPRLEVTSRLGAKFYSLADEKGVVAEAEKSLAASPKNPDLLLKLAQAQISVWQDREAVATLTRALELKPNDAALLTERGHRELPLRQFDRAAADLGRAVKIDSSRMDAYYHLGLAHYFQGQFSEAAAAFRKAAEHAPNTDEIINCTNWVYAASRRAGQTAEAARALDAVTPEMKNQAPHTEHYLNLVRLFQGRKDEAAILPPEPPPGNTDDETELRLRYRRLRHRQPVFLHRQQRQGSGIFQACSERPRLDHLGLHWLRSRNGSGRRKGLGTWNMPEDSFWLSKSPACGVSNRVGRCTSVVRRK